MKKIATLFLSSKTALFLLLAFALSIGTATFIEDKYDTVTSQVVVYRAWWFNLLIGWMAVNFLGTWVRYRYMLNNPGSLLFHFGFLMLIVGAAITRFWGYEGLMHIREGENASTFVSAEPYLQMMVTNSKGTFKREEKLQMSQIGSNDFSYSLNAGDEQPVKFKFIQYLNKGALYIRENDPSGTDIVSIKVSAEGSSADIYLKYDEHLNAGGKVIGFSKVFNPEFDISIFPENGQLLARTKEPMIGMQMGGGRPDTTQRGNILEMRSKNLYDYEGLMFAFKKLHQRSVIDFKKEEDDPDAAPVLSVSVEAKGEKKIIHLNGSHDEENNGQQVTFGDATVNVRYCPKRLDLPFYVKLNDFILTRYPGSNSPSSFASEVTVNDPETSQRFNQRIYMNHVLDHRGYRFFQSSYDQDEMGTVLSVNHDMLGTWVSYVSYLILFIGFLITLFSPNTRFRMLTHAIRTIRDNRKASLSVVLLLSLGLSSVAQDNETHVIPKAQAEKLGKVLVQTVDGRIEPLHTLAFDAMHKISKKDRFKLEGRPEMDAMQVMIDMLVDPAFWEQQKMIYINEKTVAKMIRLEGKYASFRDFLTPSGQYILSEKVEEAFRKPAAKQTGVDKELIKVDERVNLFFMLMKGNMIRIFPENNESHKWVDWNDSLAFRPLTGPIALLNADLQLTIFNYNGIFALYLQELMAGFHNGDYARSDKILGYIRDIQKNNALSANFPSERRVNAEIAYNKSGMFTNLTWIYLILSVIMTVLAFVEIFYNRSIKGIRIAQNVMTVFLSAGFLYHTYGMILRWYLSGHAPWSNGYEALLLVSWSTVLAGFLFVRNIKLIQAATAFLAGIILFADMLSNYDPQLSNLQPVLQSYWLVVHVAIITMSYGFLALGFILGIVNMIFWLCKNSNNHQKIDLLITEISFINEKNLQIGLFFATIGTFLGGVWASESWGRYWGWDAKETWALVIVIVYSIILHLRMVPQFRSLFLFNVASIFGFGSVVMTFAGVNYYLSKGLHSYAADEKAVFPLWAWIMIGSLCTLVALAALRNRKFSGKTDSI